MKNNYLKKTKMGLPSLLFFVCLLFANGIQAQNVNNYSWTPGTIGSWTTAANWTYLSTSSTVTWTIFTVNATVTVANPEIAVGDLVSGTGIAAGTTVVSYNNTTRALVLSIANTAGTGGTITFSKFGASTTSTATWTVGSPNVAIAVANASIAVGDVVSGAGIPSGTKVYSYDGANTLVLDKFATILGTDAALTFAKTVTSTVVPGALATDAVTINSGTCNLNTTTVTIAKLTVGITVPVVGDLTPLQGVLNIASGATLNVNNGVAGSSSITINGGKINNSGLLKTNPAVANTSAGLFINPSVILQGQCGIFGTGVLDISSQGNTIGCNANATLSFGTGSKVTALTGKNAITVGGTTTAGNLLITGAGFTSINPVYSNTFNIGGNTTAVVTIDAGTTIAIDNLGAGSPAFVSYVTSTAPAAGTTSTVSTFTNNGTVNLTGTWANVTKTSSSTTLVCGSAVFNNTGTFTFNSSQATTGPGIALASTGTPASNPHIFTNSGTITMAIGAIGAPISLARVATATNSGTITLSGGNFVSQLGGATSFTNSGTINSNAGLTIPTAFFFTNDALASLTIAEGKILTNSGTLTNNGNLILKSSALGTAILTSTPSIDNVTQQRYLSSNQKGWRLLSNPLANTNFATLASASNITLGDDFTGQYQSASGVWTSTDGTVNMDSQQAYKVFITGQSGEFPSYTNGPSNVTLVIKGTATNAQPTSIATKANRYYLVGNPYTAPISVAKILAANAGKLNSTVSYYDPTDASTDSKVKAGGYKTVAAGTVAGAIDDVVIPAMGAIFIQAAIDGGISLPKSIIHTGTTLQTGTYNHRTAQTTKN